MLILGIAGGTGSGKTTVVKRISELLREDEVVIIPQDSYYKDQSHLPLEERQELNFDHPDAIDWPLLIQQLGALKRGESIDQPTYSFLTCTRSTTETVRIHPAKIIIVEGILVFTCEELRKLMDIKIYVDAEADDRLLRVIARDIMERGRSVSKVMERYEKTVKPMHVQHIEPTKRFADLIIPQGGHNLVAIDVLIATIEKYLRQQ